MAFKFWKYNNFLLVFLVLVLLNGACVKRQDTFADNGGEEIQALIIPSSFKTVEGKVSREKSQSEAVKPKSGTDSKQGECIFGCIGKPSSNEIKKEDKTASFALSAKPPQRSTPVSPDSPVTGISPDYILGAEDILDVSVWKNENLSKTVLIRPDGKISLPLIGDVQAAGLTASQLRNSIIERLKEYKETPEVSIIVREINSLVVFVTGEVVHPGKLMLRSDTSVLQALILAGGFTQFASPNKIILLRRVGGVESRRRIRYKDIVSGKRPEENIILQRGDTIVVP